MHAVGLPELDDSSDATCKGLPDIIYIIGNDSHLQHIGLNRLFAELTVSKLKPEKNLLSPQLRLRDYS